MPSAEFEAVLAQLRAQPPAVPTDVADARAAIDEMMGDRPLAPDTTVRETTVAKRPAEWVAAAATPDDAPVVLYLHGGAFRIGSLHAYRPFVSQLAAASPFRFLVLDYRLAPEHPFPAAVHDVRDAFRTLLADGTPAGRIAVLGDSAGGGLAASLLLAARDAELPQPAAAVLLSPFVDLTCSAGSFERNAATDPFVDLEMCRRAVDDYLQGHDPRDPLASPVFAKGHDLAPLLIHAADTEVLCDDAVRLAQVVARGLGSVRCELWPGLTHVWHAMAPAVPEAREAVAAVVEFLSDRFAPPS
jgi:acetyl esterase/lipase